MAKKSDDGATGDAAIPDNAGADLGGHDSTASDSPNLAGLPIIDPASGNVKRGRGRPTGSTKPKSTTGSPKREKASTSSIVGIEKVLYSLHMMAASALKTEELELDQAESKLLAEAVTEVASHYNTVIDPKVIAWMGLIGVCGQIYGPRVVAMRVRKAGKGATAKPQQVAQNLPTAGNGAADDWMRTGTH